MMFGMKVAVLDWKELQIETIVHASTSDQDSFRANAMYSAFYGLKHEPFRLTPDPRFLHLAEPHRNTLRAMLEGVSYRKGLQVAVGPIGTGKTTLLYSLQHILVHESSAGRPIRSAFIINPTLTQEELFEALFDELEITSSAATKPARLRGLHELLLDSHRRNGIVLVVIDEAHLLSPELLEEIRLLLNLDNYPANVLQLILCGQPELVPLLMKPQFAALRGRVAVVSKLRTLTLPETRAYIAERLHIAGLRSESPFTAPALEEIFRQAGGTPRLINLLCDRVLTAGFRRQLLRITPDLVREAVDGLTLCEDAFSIPETSLSAATTASAPSSSGAKS
jgi:general secretion pathway protein A